MRVLALLFFCLAISGLLYLLYNRPPPMCLSVFTSPLFTLALTVQGGGEHSFNTANVLLRSLLSSGLLSAHPALPVNTWHRTPDSYLCAALAWLCASVVTVSTAGSSSPSVGQALRACWCAPRSADFGSPGARPLVSMAGGP